MATLVLDGGSGPSSSLPRLDQVMLSKMLPLTCQYRNRRLATRSRSSNT